MCRDASILAPRLGPLVFALLASVAASRSAGAQISSDNSAIAAYPQGEEIVITGQRRSAVKNVAPLATLDENAIAATGATNMAELLKAVGPVTKSASGAEPIMLLNGQRISSYQEVGTLPPEAIEKMEVLPEPEALRFGYPPTRRVLNFITKRRFQQTEITNGVGSTTHLGSVMANGNLGITHLRDDSRFSLALERKRTGSVLQSERDILPDPDVMFDAIGNITGATGGEIDPALSAMAGQIVTVAPVPGASPTLSSFASQANQPRLYDLGRDRSLSPLNDTSKAEATWGDRIGKLGASLSLGAERSRDRTLSGPATARLIVPDTHPYSPFSGPVVLNRYLTETDPLRQNQTTTKLNAGATLRGAFAGWRWDVTASVQQQMVRGLSEQQIDLTEANAAIAAGANPFVALDPSLLAARLTDRRRYKTRTMGAKSVIMNSPFRFPAGQMNVTATAEVERADADSVTRGANPFELHIGRTRSEAGLALDVPLTSKDEAALPWAGNLSVNASIIARHVSGFGSLSDRTLGASWGLIKGVQFLAQDKRSGTAPNLDYLSAPLVRLIDIPIFDYLNGRTELVTMFRGGNPDLLAERRYVRSFTFNLKPFEKRELRISASYEDVTIRDQTGVVALVTPRIESILPDLFVRDAMGTLVSASYRPTNFYRERQKLFNLTFSASGEVGKAPPQGKAGNGPKRPTYYAGFGPTFRFSDRLQLRPGTPELDLLDGDTIAGWSPGRISAYFYGAINHPIGSLGADGWYGGKSRVRSANPAGDIRTSAVLKINMNARLSMLYLFKGQEWARKLQLMLDVQNVTNARQNFRNGLGLVPNYAQRDYLDPIGRTVKVSLRKRFQAGAGEKKAKAP